MENPGTMDEFEKKTLKTSRGYTYTYYTASGDRDLPTLFFQHGWPDHAEMWKAVASSLTSTRHPMIIPDLLGYAGTDKPTDPAEYNWKAMTTDLIEISDTEKVDNLISIGHDWGAACAARLYNYHPDRVVGMVLLNVAYMTPSRQPFDLDAANQMCEKVFGYQNFSYWHLFTAEDGPSVLKAHVDRLYHAMHGSADTMKTLFTGPDAMREYLTSGVENIKLRSYAENAHFKQAFIDRMTRDGFEGPQCWYKATLKNFQHECDKDLAAGADKVNVPLLFIGAKDDAVCRPEAMYPAIQAGLLPQLEQAEMVDAAHWVPYEAPEEIASRIKTWLLKHFAK